MFDRMFHKCLSPSLTDLQDPPYLMFPAVIKNFKCHPHPCTKVSFVSCFFLSLERSKSSIVTMPRSLQSYRSRPVATRLLIAFLAVLAVSRSSFSLSSLSCSLVVEAAEASPQPQTGGTEYELIVSGEITSCSG